MILNIEDDVLNGLNITPEQARLDFALRLYVDNKITLGQGAHIASVSQAQFQKELRNRQIPIHYDIEEFDKDIATLNKQHIL